MFDYSVQHITQGDDITVWSRLPVQPLATDVLTPFSFSVLNELASRAWYQHYDRLGFDPAPRSHLLRWHKGRAYQNLSLSARLEADKAGVAPLALRVNGQPFSLCPVRKPGLLGGIKLGRSRKKIGDLLSTYAQEISSITQKAMTWYVKTRELRWTQAEVLQIMEEIERVGADSMMVFLAARHNLELLYGQLILATQGQSEFPSNLPLINSALCGVEELVESEIAESVIELGNLVNDEPAFVDWLKAGSFAHWREAVPNRKLAAAFETFLEVYGHRSMSEGELSHSRWFEDPLPVFHGVLACVEHGSRPPAKVPCGQHLPKLLDAIDVKQHKMVEQDLETIRQLQQLQSKALHALGYVWAGTRRWAIAAAQEAMDDGRLLDAQDLFFFELEEIKQMMTGEWNVSALADIHAMVAKRKSEYRQWQTVSTAEMLFDEQEGFPTHSGLPGVAGRATGPLRRLDASETDGCKDAIIGAISLDSGWALTLPSAGGFVAEGGTPVDPFIAAARLWYQPTVIGLGEHYPALVEGAQTTVDGDAIVVQQ